MDMNYTRRVFLAAPAILSAQQPSDTVRVAFIGVGNRGSFLLRNMLRHAACPATSQ